MYCEITMSDWHRCYVDIRMFCEITVSDKHRKHVNIWQSYNIRLPSEDCGLLAKHRNKFVLVIYESMANKGVS